MRERHAEQVKLTRKASENEESVWTGAEAILTESINILPILISRVMLDSKPIAVAVWQRKDGTVTVHCSWSDLQWAGRNRKA